MPIKDWVRQTVNLLPAGAAESITNAYRRARYPFIRRRHRHAREVMRAAGNPTRVLLGPFKDMAYIPHAFYGMVEAKLLGTYELELHPVIERIIRAAPACIIDIGAAEGYYAVGLALRLPTTQVIAYEIDPAGREMLAKLARLNGVENRIDIRGAADTDSLCETLSRLAADGKSGLIICDIEGVEDQLMDPSAVPELAHVCALVEIHDHINSGVGGRIFTRFDPTHEIEQIHTRPRTAADLPPGLARSDEQAADAVWERDQPMRWFFLTPRTAG